DARRVLQPVAAYPQLVGSCRQVRDQIPSLIVGDDNLAEGRRQGLRLGDHPDAGFRLPAVAVHNGAANTGTINFESGCILLAAYSRSSRDTPDCQKNPGHVARYTSHLQSSRRTPAGLSY